MKLLIFPKGVPLKTTILMLVLVSEILCIESSANETWLFYGIQSTATINSDRIDSLISLIKTAIEDRGNYCVRIIKGEIQELAYQRSNILSLENAHHGAICYFSTGDQNPLIKTRKWSLDGEYMDCETEPTPFSESDSVLVSRIIDCLLTKSISTPSSPPPNLPFLSGSPVKMASTGLLGKMILIGRAGILYPVPPNRFKVLEIHDTDTIVAEGSAWGVEAGFGFDYGKYLLEATAGIDGTRAGYLTISGEYLIFDHAHHSPYIGIGVSAAKVNKVNDLWDTSSGDEPYEKNSDGIALDGRLGCLIMRDNYFKLLLEVRGIIIINNDYDSGIRVSIGGMVF